MHQKSGKPHVWESDIVITEPDLHSWPIPIGDGEALNGLVYIA